MKFLLALTAIFLMSFTTPCVTVTEVKSTANVEEMNSKRVVFGIKQMAEELLSEKYELCGEGNPVTVEIYSIESPSVGISIGPFMKMKKETIVKLKVVKDGQEFLGEGTTNTTVKATLIDLNDENLPFSKTTFAGAVKKSLADAISKM